MNTIKIHKEAKTLFAEVSGMFNLSTKRRIESRLSPDINILQFDLTHCNFTDSEAVIFLHCWQADGNTLKLKNPPKLLFEILEVLEINKTWNFEEIVIN